MKIAFLTPEYPHPKIGSAGGIGSSLVNLIKGLKSLGHDVTVLIYGQDKDELFKENDVNFYRIKNIKVKGISAYLTQKKVQRLITRLYKDGKIDILEVADWTGFSAFINAKCPIVIKLHGSDTYFCHLEKRNVKRKNHFLEKKALKKADGIISVSQYTGELTNQLFHLNKEFTVIPNGIDINGFEPVQSENEKLTILYFGTIIRKKGVLELASIFNKVNEKNDKICLVLVGKDSKDSFTGSNSTWDIMKPIFSDKALKNVRYLGAVEYTEIPKLIDEASVCVFPTFAEALPVSWLEAMVMEKAVVASNIGWAKEMIIDGAEGFLVNPTDHNIYADRILELFNDKNKCEAFGKAARIKVKNKFSNKLIAEQTIEFYNKLLKPKH